MLPETRLIARQIGDPASQPVTDDSVAVLIQSLRRGWDLAF